jgi:exopolysaccharide biosynthesis polyprenyl glycosylphosphotransferase
VRTRKTQDGGIANLVIVRTLGWFPADAKNSLRIPAAHGVHPPQAQRTGLSPEAVAGAGARRSFLSLPKALTVLADAAAVALAMGLAFGLRRLVPGGPIHVDVTSHVVVATVSVPLWTIVFARYRLYTARRISSRLWEFAQIVHALVASVLATAGLSFLSGLRVSRGWLVLCWPLALLTVVCEREVVRRTFCALRRRGRLLRPVVVIGTNVEALGLATTLREQPGLGYKVVGFAAMKDDGRQAPPGAPLLSEVEDLLALLQRTGATGVLIATTAVDWETSNRLVRHLTEAGIHVELSSSLRDIRAERLTVRSLGCFPIIYVEPVRRGGWRALAKRAFDIGTAASGLVVLSPLFFIIALLIKVDSSGPVMFRQVRVGQNGRLFSVLKFRTMVADAERLLDMVQDLNEADGPLFKIRNDPRITGVGRALRAFSLDELPQLWNVLRNEMSIVGPRPALPSEVSEWSPELHQRVRVKPGLTGMWQVSGRTDVPFQEYVRLDLYYVDNWSLWTDLAIVAKTLPAMVLRKGGY